jgi:hypothetical protein
MKIDNIANPTVLSSCGRKMGHPGLSQGLMRIFEWCSTER